MTTERNELWLETEQWMHNLINDAFHAETPDELDEARNALITEVSDKLQSDATDAAKYRAAQAVVVEGVEERLEEYALCVTMADEGSYEIEQAKQSVLNAFRALSAEVEDERASRLETVRNTNVFKKANDDLNADRAALTRKLAEVEAERDDYKQTMLMLQW